MRTRLHVVCLTRRDRAWATTSEVSSDRAELGWVGGERSCSGASRLHLGARRLFQRCALKHAVPLRVEMQDLQVLSPTRMGSDSKRWTRRRARYRRKEPRCGIAAWGAGFSRVFRSCFARRERLRMRAFPPGHRLLVAVARLPRAVEHGLYLEDTTLLLMHLLARCASVIGMSDVPKRRRHTAPFEDAEDGVQHFMLL
jgi:hypothetical protein